LREEGYNVDHAPDGGDADFLVGLRHYDLIILDRMLPVVSGDQLLAAWRRRGRRTPILMLTALDAVADKVTGLRSGADDYVVKPFSFEELLARLEALARRSGTSLAEGSILRAGDLALDTQTGNLTCGTRSIALSATESRLMAIFMRHPGRIITRSVLVHSVWREPETTSDNTLEAHIKNLRKRLASVSDPSCLQTRRGLGYVLETSPLATETSRQ
jgi:DNA-binding response OmpR family regulator